MRWTRFVAGIILAVAMTGVSRADLLVSGYEASVNDRFYVGADKAFLGDPYDFSGVGNTVNASGTGRGQWATLVSSHYFLSAWHDHPGAGSAVTFFADNNPNGTPYTYTVASVQRVGMTDLALERLTTSVAPNIQPFAVVADNEPALTDATINVYGIPNRLGLNNIDGFAPFGVGTLNPVTGSDATGETFTYDYDAGKPEEAMLQGGDSGGPSFVVVGGQLALVGIHWFNYTGNTDPNSAPNGSGDTYVSRYINQINALMTGEQLTVVAVPEPSTMLLLIVGLPGAGLFFRRRS